MPTKTENPTGPVVYLFCFSRPYVAKTGARRKFARHYVGWTPDLEGRIEAHRRGQGARLMEVIAEEGITFTVARIWLGGDRHLERRLKRGGHFAQRLCPCCNKQLAEHRYQEARP